MNNRMIKLSYSSQAFLLVFQTNKIIDRSVYNFYSRIIFFIFRIIFPFSFTKFNQQISREFIDKVYSFIIQFIISYNISYRIILIFSPNKIFPIGLFSYFFFTTRKIIYLFIRSLTFYKSYIILILKIYIQKTSVLLIGFEPMPTAFRC